MERRGARGPLTPRASGRTAQAGLAARERGANRPGRQRRGQQGQHRAAAVSPTAVEWQAIKWQKAPSLVRRLQARIVKATQAGSRGKGRALQRRLPHSVSATRRAVKRGTENQGNRPPGVAGVSWERLAAKAPAVSLLRQPGYRPLAVRRVSIPPGGSPGPRPLSIPCMPDRAMLAVSLLAREPSAEPLAAPNS